MKKMILLFTVPVISCTALFAQTNTFPANGNVGIGTLAPTEKLTVSTALVAKEKLPQAKNKIAGTDERL